MMVLCEVNEAREEFEEVFCEVEMMKVMFEGDVLE